MSKRFMNPILIVLLLSGAAHVQAQPTLPHASHTKVQARRLSVLDYFNLMPGFGIDGTATRQERREMLHDNRAIIDVRHDYMRVQPDSSPTEQIVVFRSRNKPDLVADSMPDYQSDYNGLSLYRLQNGKLRNVTRQMLPMPPDIDHLLYELPRFGTTIRVFRFDIEKESRRHVFDLQWRGGHFVKVR